MDYISPLTDKINAIAGIIAALFSYVFGEFWLLFVGFFGANLLDTVTGIIKARKKHTENSEKGAEGVLKKVCYWILIMVSFGMSVIFGEIGKVIGIDLGFTSAIGWFVLASLFLNELRSILENLVECSVRVPEPLIRGLEIADKAIDQTFKIEDDSDEKKEDNMGDEA